MLKAFADNISKVANVFEQKNMENDENGGIFLFSNNSFQSLLPSGCPDMGLLSKALTLYQTIPGTESF